MRPLSTHSSPSRRAVVVMLWVLVPASGSVIAKAIVRRAVADAGQPALLLLLGAVAADDRAADRRAHDHEQQRAALRGELLADRGDVADAAAPAAVLLGDVDAEVAVLADLQPQVGGLAAGARLLGEVVAAVLGGELRHLLAQRLALLGLAERVLTASPSPSVELVETTARTAPAATWSPGFTSISVTVPAYGALTRCCIFIASSTSTGWPASTCWPASTATLTTVPGIGASRLPVATASAGSTNLGTTRQRRRGRPASRRRPGPRRRRRRTTCGHRPTRAPRWSSWPRPPQRPRRRTRRGRPTTRPGAVLELGDLRLRHDVAPGDRDAALHGPRRTGMLRQRDRRCRSAPVA